MKINVALSELPDFTALPGTGAGPQHHGTMHICPTMEYIERAYDDAKYGHPSAHPMHRMHDGDGAGRHARPAGQAHHAHVHPVLPRTRSAGLDLEAEKDKFADRCFDI